jgi:signal transduction histidine kinase
VRDILLFAGSSPATLQPVTLKPILTDAISSAAAAVPGAPRVEPTGEDVMVLANPEMLRELLLNLILNACQAMRGHGSDPIVARMSATGDVGRIEILDRGPGIPNVIRDRVFEPFFTTKHGGTGLGLAIVKRLADLQGGSVSLEDREGGGTSAAVTLPLHRS